MTLSSSLQLDLTDVNKSKMHGFNQLAAVHEDHGVPVSETMVRPVRFERARELPLRVDFGAPAGQRTPIVLGIGQFFPAGLPYRVSTPVG